MLLPVKTVKLNSSYALSSSIHGPEVVGVKESQPVSVVVATPHASGSEASVPSLPSNENPRTAVGAPDRNVTAARSAKSSATGKARTTPTPPVPRASDPLCPSWTWITSPWAIVSGPSTAS